MTGIDLVLRDMSGMCVAPARQEFNLWHKEVMWTWVGPFNDTKLSGSGFGSDLREQWWDRGLTLQLHSLLVLTAMLWAGLCRCLQSCIP